MVAAAPRAAAPSRGRAAAFFAAALVAIVAGGAAGRRIDAGGLGRGQDRQVGRGFIGAGRHAVQDQPQPVQQVGGGGAADPGRIESDRQIEAFRPGMAVNFKVEPGARGRGRQNGDVETAQPRPCKLAAAPCSSSS